MFNKLIAAITFFVTRELQLEGYSQIALVWGAQEGRTDRRGNARRTSHQSPLRYMLSVPELRTELEALYKQAHGVSANFAQNVADFFISTADLKNKLNDPSIPKSQRRSIELDLQKRQMTRTTSIEKFEQALLQLPVPADAGWSFSIGSQTGRLLAGNPSASRVLDTDEFLQGLKDVLAKS